MGKRGFEGVRQANVCKAYGEGDRLLKAGGTVTRKRFGNNRVLPHRQKANCLDMEACFEDRASRAWRAFGKSRFVSTDGIHGCICLQHKKPEHLACG